MLWYWQVDGWMNLKNRVKGRMNAMVLERVGMGYSLLAYLRSFRCLAKHKYAPSLYGDMLLSHILTVTFEWFVLKEIFFAQK